MRRVSNAPPGDGVLVWTLGDQEGMNQREFDGGR